MWQIKPDLSRITGLDGPELDSYMLRLNLLLVREAPLEYLQDVLWSFSSYWLPTSGELANLESRVFQLIWGIVHFCLIGAFAVNLVLLIGAATYVRRLKINGHNLIMCSSASLSWLSCKD